MPTPNDGPWLTWLTMHASLLSAIGTFCAVLVSLWLGLRQGLNERRSRRREQAEKVTAWFVPYTGIQDNEDQEYVGLRISNGSQVAAYDLIAQTVPSLGTGYRSATERTEQENYAHGAFVGLVPPGIITTRIAAGSGGMYRRFGVEIAFKDAAGRRWYRAANGALKEVKKHPIDFFNLSHPVGWGTPPFYD